MNILHIRMSNIFRLTLILKTSPAIKAQEATSLKVDLIKKSTYVPKFNLVLMSQK